MQSSFLKPYAPFNLPPNNPESLRIRQAKFPPNLPPINTNSEIGPELTNRPLFAPL